MKAELPKLHYEVASDKNDEPSSTASAKGKETAHSRAFAARHLKSGEMVLVALTGWIGDMMGRGKDTQHNGALLVTTERVVFHRKGFFGEVLETIPLAKITSVESRSLLGYRVLALHTSHDELRFKTFEPVELFEAARQEIEDRRGDHAPATPSLAASPLEQIARLAELRDNGLVTTAEFEAKKAELLARL